MARLNGAPRAVNPIYVEPATPWEKEQQKLLGVRVGRTYQTAASPTATSKAAQAVAGSRVSGAGRLRGGAGFKPGAQALPAKP